MFLYIAGNLQVDMLEKIANRAHANHVLCSYADRSAQKAAEHFCVQPHRRVLVDSGAYSAWTKSTAIPFGKYMDFCKRIMGMAKCPVTFVALDVIPGVYGREPSPSEIQKACDEGWENYQEMQRKGIFPCLMTYHEGEHKQQLTRIMDDSDYFALSPRKGAGTTPAGRLAWLELVFDYIQGKDKSTIKKKIHGLGVSSIDWMERFPFYSVDNTVWLNAARGNYFRAPNPHVVEWWSLEDLTRKAEADGVESWPLREMLGFGVYGEKPDPDARFGTYWQETVAIMQDVETERRVTELWRSKGISWDDQSHIKPWLLTSQQK